jgi:hypothetical protein
MRYATFLVLSSYVFRASAGFAAISAFQHFRFSAFQCFLQITSAKVLSVLRKYQMPSHSIKTTTAIESRKPDR